MGEKYNDNNNEKVNHTRERERVSGTEWVGGCESDGQEKSTTKQ